MADYGGKIDGAIKINENLATVKKINKDDKYYLKVNSETGNVEVFARRPSGQTTLQGETTPTYSEIKIGDYDPQKKKFSHIEGAATQAEQDLFYDPQHTEQYLVNHAKTILEKGLLKDGTAPNPDEAKKQASDTIDGTDLSFELADQDRVNTNLSTFQKAAEGISRKSYAVLKYPETLDTNTQDTIHFTLKEVIGVEYSGDIFGGSKPFDRQYNENIEGSVTLPIQSGISDSNLVKWGPNELDAINAALAGASLDLMNRGSPSEFIDRLGTMATGVKEKVFNEASDAFKPAILAGLAGQAVGVQGLLSRATGTVLNPNLELLFQGPQLRPFTFQFRLSPRGIKEAQEVKKIIRFFKQAMSVKTISTNAFLKTPHVFDIKYQTSIDGKDEHHPSLSRIKTCALLGCDVDYTPDGTYATFNDTEKTMTSYNLTLRFNELEPVFDKDYTEIDGDDNDSSIIGY